MALSLGPFLSLFDRPFFSHISLKYWKPIRITLYGLQLKIHLQVKNVGSSLLELIEFYFAQKIFLISLFNLKRWNRVFEFRLIEENFLKGLMNQKIEILMKGPSILQKDGKSWGTESIFTFFPHFILKRKIVHFVLDLVGPFINRFVSGILTACHRV